MYKPGKGDLRPPGDKLAPKLVLYGALFLENLTSLLILKRAFLPSKLASNGSTLPNSTMSSSKKVSTFVFARMYSLRFFSNHSRLLFWANLLKKLSVVGCIMRDCVGKWKLVFNCRTTYRHTKKTWLWLLAQMLVILHLVFGNSTEAITFAE